MLPGGITRAELLGKIELSLQQPAPPPAQQVHHHQSHRQVFRQQHRAIQFFQTQILAKVEGDLTPLHIRHASFSITSSVAQQQSMNFEDQQPTLFGEAATTPREGGDTPDSKQAYAFQKMSTISSSPSASPSLWHRMKWTDSMVRLLISVVYRVGDDGEQQIGYASSAKSTKKSSASVLLQKKGKWKSVSHTMMEKGFYVSPQQCEDKFNDLNKRYKRVTDILGKGMACRVVENQAVLDAMRHLTPKAKEEVRKLLNSKQLFFSEMCTYHNAGGSGGASSSNCTALPLQRLFPMPKANQQHCLHHLQANEAAAEETIDEDDNDLDRKEDGDGNNEDDDEEIHDNLSLLEHHHQHKYREEDLDEDSKGVPKKSKAASELTAMSSAAGERRRLRNRAAELEEQRVVYQCRAFQLERQHFKWLRFKTNKEQQMERMKLENDRLRLENDQMLLLLRQKEFKLVYGANGGCSGAAHYPSVAEQ